MTLTIADISTELLMDTTTALQEIECRMNARAFTAVHHPEQGYAVKQSKEVAQPQRLPRLASPALASARTTTGAGSP